MRRILIGVSVALIGAAMVASVALAARPTQSWQFVAPLSGAAERPNPIDTQARGVAIFDLSADGQSLSYKIIASNIENITMAHIHCCAGEDGTAGISVWLYPEAPPAVVIPGRHDGILATGTITAADVVGGPPAAAEDRIGALVEFIQAGQAYVNVHTVQNGPGEIRGQLP
jgi:hypothetical protein